jgi:hypothetical protein
MKMASLLPRFKKKKKEQGKRRRDARDVLPLVEHLHSLTLSMLKSGAFISTGGI